eukprot:Pgem_evm1s5974
MDKIVAEKSKNHGCKIRSVGDVDYKLPVNNLHRRHYQCNLDFDNGNSKGEGGGGGGNSNKIQEEEGE